MNVSPLKLVFLIAEDTNLSSKDIEVALEAARAACNLSHRQIALCAAKFIRVVSGDTLKEICVNVATKSPCPRITIIDLDLCAPKSDGAYLKPEKAGKMHNAAVPKALRVSSLADRTKAGGYLVAWHALQSDSDRQLILFATNQAAADPVRERMESMRKAAGKWGKYDLLDGGLDKTDARSRYVVQAVKKWLAAFGNPHARLFPDHAKTWFTDTSNEIPHNFRDAIENEKYRRSICEYLARVLQMDDGSVYGHWDGLPKELKEQLHKYLTGFVGGHSAAHVGKGYRLRWKHIPLLAVASAPPPGSWFFHENTFTDGNNDILTGDSSDDKRLVDCLVGDSEGSSKGLLQQLLCDKTYPIKSNLQSCLSDANSCSLTFAFDIHTGLGNRPSLAENYLAGRKNGRAVGGDVSVALFALDGFLRSRGCAIELLAGENQIRIKKV